MLSSSLLKSENHGLVSLTEVKIHILLKKCPALLQSRSTIKSDINTDKLINTDLSKYLTMQPLAAQWQIWFPDK